MGRVFEYNSNVFFVVYFFFKGINVEEILRNVFENLNRNGEAAILDPICIANFEDFLIFLFKTKLKVSVSFLERRVYSTSEIRFYAVFCFEYRWKVYSVWCSTKIN